MAISTKEASQTAYAHPEVLVETGWVADNLGKPGIKMSLETRAHLSESVARIDEVLKANMQRTAF